MIFLFPIVLTSPCKSNDRKCVEIFTISRVAKYSVPRCYLLRSFKIIDIYIDLRKYHQVSDPNNEQFTDRDTIVCSHGKEECLFVSSFIRKLYVIPRKSNTTILFVFSEHEINRRDLRNSGRAERFLRQESGRFSHAKRKVVARYRRRSRRLREGSTIHDVVGLRVIATSKDPARSV